MTIWIPIAGVCLYMLVPTVGKMWMSILSAPEKYFLKQANDLICLDVYLEKMIMRLKFLHNDS
jgi:hypothetical protein